MEKQEKIESVPCENCPKGVPEGKMFTKDGKTYCCGECHQKGPSDNTCEFC